ncbi:MAG: CvpA family protein [Erysipelotrichaceae bacterium]
METINVYMIVNIVVILFYIIMFYRGVKTGFLVQLANTLGIIVSLLVSAYVAPVFAEYIDLWPHSWTFTNTEILNTLFYSKINELAWFFLLILLLNIVFSLIKPAFKALQKVPLIKQLSGILGGALSIVLTTLWILLICMLLSSPLIKNGIDIYNNTILYNIDIYFQNGIVSFLDPMNDSETINKIIMGIEELNDDDKTWLRNFLDENHFEDLPIEEFTQRDESN